MEVVENSHTKTGTRHALTWLVLLTLVSACGEEAAQQNVDAGQHPERSASASKPSVRSPATVASKPASSTTNHQSVEPTTPESEQTPAAASSDREPPLEASVPVSSDEPQTTSASAPVFLVTGDAGSVYWEPNLERIDSATGGANTYAHVDLTLSSPTGRVIKQRFAPGEPIGLSAAQGALPDGLYKWETVTAPIIDSHVRAEMAVVREAGDFEAERRLMQRLRKEGYLPTEEQARNNVQSGHFRVRDGQILVGNMVEN